MLSNEISILQEAKVVAWSLGLSLTFVLAAWGIAILK
jgi:hypothetical protein